MADGNHNYNRVQTAPTTPATTAPDTLATPDVHSPLQSLTAAFANAGKVVANAAVGFGPPETVTVGAEAIGDDVFFAEEADAASRMLNF